MKTLVLILALLPSVGFAAINMKMANDAGKTEFLAIGNPGFLKIKGVGKAPQGKLTLVEGKLNGALEVDLSSLDTGMDLRNRHMKEKYLQVGEHPTATVVIKDHPLNWDFAKPSVANAKLMGQLKFHGVEKPVEIKFSIDEKANVHAEFEIQITDYKVEIPSFMGVTVADKVTIAVDSQITKEI